MPDAIDPAGIAYRLFQAKVIDFSRKEGWSLRIHKDYPHAPKAPFYTDVRLLPSYVSLFRDVVDLYVAMLRKSGVKLDRIADVPTASAPIATAMMMRTNTPLIRPRLSPKDYGQETDIDGMWHPEQRVGIIDDIRTTGKTKETIIAMLRRAQLTPEAIFVLIDYDPSLSPIDRVPVFAAYQWHELLRYYRDQDMVSEETHHRSLNYNAALRQYITRQPKEIFQQE